MGHWVTVAGRARPGTTSTQKRGTRAMVRAFSYADVPPQEGRIVLVTGANSGLVRYRCGNPYGRM